MGFPTSRSLDVNDIAFDQVIRTAKDILRDDETYPRKFRGQNYFKQLSEQLRATVREMLSSHDEFKLLRWHFEVFHSVEAVGMHNDRNFFPKLKERCDRGFIIPLEWVGMQPKTRYFDIFFEDKVNWTGKAFKTLEGEYKMHEAKNLKENFVDMPWEQKKIIFFDARQIHEACEFTKGPDDYKLSINGLGYSPYEPVGYLQA